MKIRWLILTIQVMFFFEGLFLIVIGLLSIQNYFTEARISFSFGVILINIAVIPSFLHKNIEKTKILSQPTFASSQQVLCTLCKRNVIKADYCSICGHKLDAEEVARP